VRGRFANGRLTVLSCAHRMKNIYRWEGVMKRSRIALAAQSRGKGVFSVSELPERYRMTQNDLDDLQRDVEPLLRSGIAGGSALGAYGSFRRRRW
jgi:hypothetical protein